MKGGSSGARLAALLAGSNGSGSKHSGQQAREPQQERGARLASYALDTGAFDDDE